ncbi:MAG TPA: hypothetical protein VMJ72_02330 [Candidatus Paceibacterota bacterium]|nr:hypothetical protein [Candidatus Paceibacterota bacterium]
MPKNHRNRLLRWLMIVAAVLFVAAVASLFFGGNSFSPNNVTLTLATSDRATSGDELTYTVTYRNDTKVQLTNLSFRMFYPAGSIVLVNGQPTTPDSEGFTVDSLAPGQEGSHDFKAFIVGDKGSIEAAHVHLVFQAGTLTSSFEKDAQASTTITALPVTLTLVAPPTIVSGQTIQYILDMRNDSSADLSDMKIQLTYPDGFTVQQAQPTADSGNGEWDIASLKMGAGKRITVSGTLTGNEQEAKTVTATLQRNLNGQYVDYVRTDASTTISSPMLSVDIVPNGSRDYVAFPGDSLRYVISYSNGSRFTLLGLSLAVTLEGDMYDTSRLQLTNGSYNDATKTITFDSSGVPAFAQLPPGQSGSINFTVPLKAGFTGGAGTKTSYVKATANLMTPNIPPGVDASEVSATDSVTTKIGTQPSFDESVLYDNGSGTGPIPPKVGQATTYTVHWQLTNPSNDVTGAKVSATLPPGVSFVSAGTVAGGSAPVFDHNRNTVTWTIGTLPYGTGVGIPQYTANFTISITPSSNQLGSSVGLVSGATFSGTDSFTGGAVQVPFHDMTTDDVDNHPDDGRVTQ